MVHWVERGADRVELWAVPDHAYLELSPERVPAEATLLETVSSPRRASGVRT
jgi:hypothetical protein